MNKATKWYAGPLYVIMALALVAGLTLVPVMVPTLVPVAGPIVEASSVSNVTVWSANYTPAAEANYTINFTTTKNLTADEDTIVIEFPTGTTANTSLNNITAATTWVNGTAATNVTTGGRRLSITPSANVTAGSVTVVIGNSTSPDEIINPSPEGNYTLTVYTSQDTTPVTSAAYTIDNMITVGSITVANTSVNTYSQYTIPITTTTALAQYDTITIIFPGTTTVPTSINTGSNITVNGTALSSTANYTGDNTTKTVTIDVPAAPGTAAWNLVFTQGAHIKNPITVNSSYWKIWAYTSKDRGANVSANYSTTTGNQSQITQVNWSTHDDYIANNTCGGTAFSIETLDVNGALCNVSAATTFTLTADAGSFYSDDTCDTAIGTISISANWHNSSGFYYKCATPGTQNVSARDLNGSWARDNFSVIVNPMVQLWGGGVIVGNYTTIAAAEAAALPYDTIKVLPSTYDPGSTITIDVPHLTLESTGGAAQTIINGTDIAIKIHNAENVTVDGFTIENPSSTGIWCHEADNATIKNNIVRNTTAAVTGIDVSWCATGVTVSNNQLQTNASIILHASDCTVSGNSVYRPLWITPCNADMNNVTITNNTICANYSDSGIQVTSVSGYEVRNIVIEGNTISNRSNLGGIYFGSTGMEVSNVSITNNTITNCNEGIIIVSTPTWNSNNTIQKNNIYNNTGYGINNTNSETLTATLNYWGDVSGPGGYGPGSGNNVSSTVTFEPWLDAPYPGGNTTYGSNITLQLNWNFISVPKALSNATFGFLLSGQNISVSYSYDPGTGWTLLNNSSPVEVLASYWVDANAAGIINLTYVIVGQEVPASKDLTGDKWNAVGFSNITAATANATLKSVEGSWSTVMGWNATSQEYDAAMIYAVNCDSGNNMNPGKGYWVWMTANDTLSALS
jgi:hypothetical protein